MKTFVILLSYNDDRGEGSSWWKRNAKTAEEAVGQLMTHLGKEATGYKEVLAIEVKEIISVRRETRWAAHHVEGGQ